MNTDVTALDMALARSPLTANVLERLDDLEAAAFGDAERPWVARRRAASALTNVQEIAALRARLDELAPAAPKA